MRLTSIDRVICILPALGALDVMSTFFAAWRGYSIYLNEAGLFASYFAEEGLLHAYAVAYISILAGLAAVLLYIKRDVSTGKYVDELLLLVLAAVVCLSEAILVAVIVSNFLIAMGRLTPLGAARWLIYLSVIMTIVTYIWDEMKYLLGFNTVGEN